MRAGLSQQASRPVKLARLKFALLRTPGQSLAPSNDAALALFRRAAEGMGIEAELITAADLHRLEQFDGLLIRDHTRIDDYTFAFAQRAAELGIALVDDPVSMHRCSSKLRQSELFEALGVPTPKTVVLTRETLPLIPALLGLPCVIKEPESSFSRGVHCVASEAELVERVTALLTHTPALIAQEFLPTGFDWRIGLVDRQPIFACRYHMVPGHWQVVRDAGTPEYCEGRTEAVALVGVPSAVLAAARLASNAIGDGFYGVDVKELDDRCVVIEVNDNPNVDAGHEDGVARLELYEAVIGTIARRAFGARR